MSIIQTYLKDVVPTDPISMQTQKTILEIKFDKFCWNKFEKFISKIIFKNQDNSIYWKSNKAELSKKIISWGFSI